MSQRADVLSVAKLRLGDLEKLERQSAEAQIKTSRGKVTFGDAMGILKERIAKNGQERTIPMIPEARALLERMRAERKDEPLTEGITPLHECQMTMDLAAKLVGMERITHHDLRHLFATRCIESGVDIPTVSRWLGHNMTSPLPVLSPAPDSAPSAPVESDDFLSIVDEDHNGGGLFQSAQRLPPIDTGTDLLADQNLTSPGELISGLLSRHATDLA